MRLKLFSMAPEARSKSARVNVERMAHSPRKHYTDQPSGLISVLQTRGERTVLHVQGGGFVTSEMVEQTMARLSPSEVAPQKTQPTDILVDLREVAGYDHECLRYANRWLTYIERLGVQRVALVANSSVLRTASSMAAKATAIDLRMFDAELAASKWLDHSLSC